MCTLWYCLSILCPIHTADADATKQFRRVGVGGVYWALQTEELVVGARDDVDGFLTLALKLFMYLLKFSKIWPANNQNVINSPKFLWRLDYDINEYDRLMTSEF